MSLRIRKPRTARRPPQERPRAAMIVVGTLAAYAAFLRGAEAGASAAAVHAAPEAEVQFEVAAGPLTEVMRAFHASSGIRVEVPSALATLRSPGVRGQMRPVEALRRLLDGIPVAFRFASRDEVRLELRVSENVDVTGQRGLASPRYTAALRDVPQTVTVISEDLIQEQGATTLRDVLRNVPGITMQAGEGGVPAGDNLSIRGFSARTDIFVDGVRDFGGYTRDPFNLEQVEVAKGPSSAYVGRGSTGGSVNLVTKTPQGTASREVTAGVGSDRYKRATVDANQPLGDDASLRLNAMWQDADAPGRDVVGGRRWGLSPTLAVGLGQRTQLTAGWFHLDQDNVPDYGIPWVPLTNTALASHAGDAPPVDYDNFYGLSARDYEDTVSDIGTLQVRHQATEAVALRSQFRYGNARRDSLITAPRFVATDSTDIRRTDWKSRDQEDVIWSNQSDVAARFSTGALRHRLVAGLELSREKDENFTRAETAAGLPSTDLFAPNPDDPYTGALVRTGAVNTATATSRALYVLDTTEITRRWEITGGLRLESFDVDYVLRDVTGASTPLARKDGMLSWRLGVVHKPRPEATVYAVAGTSLNPSAEGLSLTAATALVAPETSRTLEVGARWEIGRRLGITTAAFRTDKTNARTPGVDPGDPATVLEGEQRVDGLELGVTGRLARFWNVMAGYTLMDGDIVKSNNPVEVGRELHLVPRHSASLWTTVELPRGIGAGAGVQYMGEVYRNAANTGVAPSYWLFNAMASYAANDRLTLRLAGNNLLDADYADRVGGGHFIPGPGRSLSVTADLGF